MNRRDWIEAVAFWTLCVLVSGGFYTLLLVALLWIGGRL